MQDTAIYQFLGSLYQVAERCASSGSSCGSHFLDLAFRAYLEQWHRTRNIPLTDGNLEHYMHSFTYVQKLIYEGEHEDRDEFYFECHGDSRLYRNGESRLASHCVAILLTSYPCAISPVAPPNEFVNGQLIVLGSVLRTQIFDPVIRQVQIRETTLYCFCQPSLLTFNFPIQVLSVLETQLSREKSPVEALLLVGGFSRSPYLFRCIQVSGFRVVLISVVLIALDPVLRKRSRDAYVIYLAPWTRI